MIIKEEEQFDSLPYKWTQDQDYVNIRFPLMQGETFENEDAVQITNNEEHGHLFALSDGNAGRTVVDIDLVQKINVEESSFKVEDDQLVFKLKKIADGNGITSLDFGDCYTEVSKPKMITILNDSYETLDLFFSSDLSAPILTFELVSEDQILSEEESDKKTLQERIEEISIRPGEQKQVIIRYTPDVHSYSDPSLLTKLVSRSFNIYISKDPKKLENDFFTIQVTANVCSSIVELRQTSINFGDSSIGSFKYATVELRNISEIPAHISLDFSSKIITCNTKKATIRPKQSILLTFRLSPRRVNANYKKQITIINLNNRNNDGIISIQSNNIDKNMLMFHALFYDVRAPSQHNFANSISFDSLVVNKPVIRKFQISNTSRSPISLKLSNSSPDEIKLYVINPQTSPKKADAKYASEEKSASTSPSPSSTHSDSSSTFDDILFLEKISKSSDDQTDLKSETELVQEEIEARKSIEKLIVTGFLIECSVLDLEAKSDLDIYVLFKPSSELRTDITGTLKKIEEKVYIHLLSYKIDQSSQSDVSQEQNEIPPRELTILAKICKSLFDLTQKNINFGTILDSEERTKTIGIINMSEVPLYFRVKKSGSIASGDLHVDADSKFGVLRTYASRELKFKFKPSLSGKFFEKLTFYNAQDPEESEDITIKADIKKHQRFKIKNNDIDFGDVFMNQTSAVKRLVITNTTKHRRLFDLKVEYTSYENWVLKYDFDLEQVSVSEETEKLETELEKVEHKLRICIRKGKDSKVAKLTQRVNEIKKSLSFTDEADESLFFSSEDESDRKKRRRFKVTENGIRFAIPPKATQIVNMAITPTVLDESFPALDERGNGRIIVYESNNIDSQKIVTFNANVLTSKKRVHTEHKRIQPKQNVDKPKLDSPEAPVPTISVSPASIDLGEVNVEEKVHCSFVINNNSAESVGYVLLMKSTSAEAKFAFSQNNGMLPPNGKVNIDVHFETFSMGPQRHYITVQNLISKKIHSILIACNPQSPPPVFLPGLNDQQEFDFGFTYVSPQAKISKIIPVVVVNKKNQNLSLDVISNSSSQLSVYQDSKATIKAHDVALPSMGERTIYVTLSPNLSTHAMQKGLSRYLLGGLRFQIYNEDRTKKIYERAVKYRSIAGRAIVQCATSDVDFGCISSLQNLPSASFTIENMNMHMPLEFEIDSETNSVELSETSGTLDCVSAAKKGQGSSSKEIHFTLKIKTYGIHMDRIRIFNKKDRELLHELKVRVFADDKQSLETDLNQTNSGVDFININTVYATLSTLKDRFIVLSAPKKLEYLNEVKKLVADNVIHASELLPTTRVVAMHPFMLKNKTDRDMILTAESDVNCVLISDESFVDQKIKREGKGDNIMFAKNRQYYTSLPLKLRAHEEKKVYLFVKDIPDISEKHRDVLLKGKTVSVSGAILLTDISQSKAESLAVKLIYMNASLCISEGELETSSINLGKIGYINNWMNDFFTFHLRNKSEVQLVVKPVVTSDEIEVLSSDKDGCLYVEPLETVTVKSVLHAKKLINDLGSNMKRHIDLINLHNPSNKMRLEVTATVTRRAWKFNRIEQNHTITLPILQHPSVTSLAYSARTFTMINQSDKLIECKFEFISDPVIRSFLKVEILNNETSAPLRDYQFKPNESISVRVRSSVVTPDYQIPQALLKWVRSEYQQETKLRFGELKLRAVDQRTEVFLIWGSLSQKRTFQLSANSLQFYPSKALTIQSKSNKNVGRKNEKTKRVLSQTFTVTNAKLYAPLHFKFEYSVPEASNLQVTVVPVQGLLEPGLSAVLSVFLESKDGLPIDSIPDASYVEVLDIHAPLSFAMLPLQMSSQLTDAILPVMDTVDTLVSPTSVPKNSPTISLTGCAPISSKDTNRYEINVGQHSQNSVEPVTWDITLQNTSTTPIEYVIYEVGKSKDDQSWLRLSKTEGILEEAFDPHTITLTFSTRTIQTHSAYLIIENKNNPDDMKTVRVNMEVVLSGRSAAKKLFNVLVDGTPIDQNNVLDLGEVFIGTMVRHRSIDILNLSDVELEFHLTSNLIADAETELHFSLSLTSLKSFHTLRIDPYGRTRVYIMYKPNYDRKEAQPSSLTSLSPSYFEELQLFIKCRLVKGYQEVITLRAQCIPPQIELQTNEFLFVAEKDTGNDTDASIEPESSTLIVENLFDEPLQYMIRSDFCVYFTVEAPSECVVPNKDKQSIIIRPNIQRIFSSAEEIFQQGKYIEEHFTLYNKNNMKEKWWIYIRFTRGILRQFFTAPGPRNSFAFSSLEERIGELLRQFKRVCDKSLLRIDNQTIAPRSVQIEQIFQNKQFNQMYFDLRFLTDELVFYGLKGKPGQTFFDLAKLLYSVLFSHKIFTIAGIVEESSSNTTKTIIPPVLLKWGGQLSYFLSYFPEKKEELKVLSDANENLFS